MRETSESFGLRDRSKIAAAASMTIVAQLCRQKSLIASRMNSPAKSGRQERFAVIARKQSAWRRSMIETEGCVWRDVDFEIAEKFSSEHGRRVVTWNSKAADVRIVRASSNQPSEPTPTSVTTPAAQEIAPAAVVAHL